MKAIFMRKWAMPILTLLLAFAGIGGAKAQITEIHDGKATVNIYIRFTNNAEVRNLRVTYHYNNNSSRTVQLERDAAHTEEVLGKTYFKITATDVNLDPNSTLPRLQYPVIIRFGDLQWREGILAGTHNNGNDLNFWGDTYIFVQQRYVGLIRYDYTWIDDEMEQSLLYEYNKDTGLSKRMWESDPNTDNYGYDRKTGKYTFDFDTQTPIPHVNHQSSWDDYPDVTNLFLVRKSAYDSYKFSISILGIEQGGNRPEIIIPGNNDIFYASKVNGGNDASVLFNNFSTSEIAERSWPTGCTADWSCTVRSETAEGLLDGFVGHLKLIVSPKDKKWATEAWIEHDTSDNVQGWATFCTPYDVTVPAGLLVLTVTDVVKPEQGSTPGRINMQTMADYAYIPARTGVVTKGRGKFEFHPWTGATDPTTYKDGNNMQFVELTEINNLPYVSDGNTHYVLTYAYDPVSESYKPKFVQAVPDADTSVEWGDKPMPDGPGRIPPFKSYLKIASSDVAGTSGDPARELIPVMGDEASDIAPTAIMPSTNGAAYDLTGRRYDASARSLKPGIYVVNGRKLIVR